MQLKMSLLLIQKVTEMLILQISTILLTIVKLLNNHITQDIITSTQHFRTLIGILSGPNASTDFSSAHFLRQTLCLFYNWNTNSWKL